jgi:hypothetical protein
VITRRRTEVCAHCGSEVEGCFTGLRRGLCEGCRRTPEIAEQHPSREEIRKRLTAGKPSVDEAGKLGDLAARAKQGLPLFGGVRN